MKLIDKDAVLAEIERRYSTNLIGNHSSFRNGKCEALREVLSFIDTLEVKEVEEEPYVMGKTGKFTTTTK